MGQKVSTQGAAFSASWEGCYLYTYRCSAGVLTDGIGNTAAAGIRAPRPGGRITLEQALSEFEINIDKYAEGVRRAIHAPLVQCEFDMAVSFHMNTGAIKTGSIDDKLNRGDRSAALATWMLYVNANGKRIQGLVNRRKSEASTFLSGKYPDRGIMLKTTPGVKGRVVHPRDLPWGREALKYEIDIEADTPPLPERRPKDNVFIRIWRYIKKVLGL